MNIMKKKSQKKRKIKINNIRKCRNMYDKVLLIMEKIEEQTLQFFISLRTLGVFVGALL